MTSFGFCPTCGAPGAAREKRPNGDDICAEGHKYKSGLALAEPPRRILVAQALERVDACVEDWQYALLHVAMTNNPSRALKRADVKLLADFVRDYLHD